MVEYRLHNKSAAVFKDLLVELQKARSVPMFRTFVPNGPGELVIFCTTNEKVHLGLGKLSADAQRKLARIFKNETDCGDELLFNFAPADGQPEPRNLFVTASREREGTITFHLAPGH